MARYVKIDIMVGPEYTVCPPATVVLCQGRPDAMPVVVLHEFEGNGGMMLVPSGLLPAQSIRLIRKRDKCGVGNGKMDLAFTVGWVEYGLEVRAHLYLLRNATMDGIIAIDEDLECSVVGEMHCDVGVCRRTANTPQDFAHELRRGYSDLGGWANLRG